MIRIYLFANFAIMPIMIFYATSNFTTNIFLLPLNLVDLCKLLTHILLIRLPSLLVIGLSVLNLMIILVRAVSSTVIRIWISTNLAIVIIMTNLITYSTNFLIKLKFLRIAKVWITLKIIVLPVGILRLLYY